MAKDRSKTLAVGFSEPPSTDRGAPSAVPEGGIEANLAQTRPWPAHRDHLYFDNMWMAFQAFVPDSVRRSPDRDLLVLRYATSFRHHPHWFPLMIHGTTAVTPQHLSAFLLKFDQQYHWRGATIHGSVGADLSTLGTSPKPKTFFGCSLSQPVSWLPGQAKFTMAAESGYQVDADSLDILDVHTCTERSLHTAVCRSRTFSVGLSNSELATDLTNPAWSLLGSYRQTSQVSSTSLGALFQYFPTQYTKADCGAIFSFIKIANETHSVLTAASRWRFLHPNIGMESHISLKISTGFQSQPYAILVCGVTLPETKLVRVSMSLTTKLNAPHHQAHGFRLEMESQFDLD
jgi:hypothetical protein